MGWGEGYFGFIKVRIVLRVGCRVGSVLVVLDLAPTLFRDKEGCFVRKTSNDRPDLNLPPAHASQPSQPAHPSHTHKLSLHNAHLSFALLLLLLVEVVVVVVLVGADAAVFGALDLLLSSSLRACNVWV